MAASSADDRLLALALSLHSMRTPDRVVAAFREQVPELVACRGEIWLLDAERSSLVETADGRERAADAELTRLMESGACATAGDELRVGLRGGDRPLGLVVLHGSDAVVAEEPAWPTLCAVLASALASAVDNEARRTSEEMLRSLVEQLPAVPYVTEPVTGSALYVSPQLERIFGFHPDEWLHSMTGWAGQVHPDDREAVSSYTAAVAACSDYEGEYRLLDAGGNVRWVWDMAVTVRDERGNPAAVHGVILDVTKRKEAEQALDASRAHLREAEERYRNLVEQLPLAIYVDALDATATSIYNSPQNTEITGYTDDEWRADPDLFSKVLHPADRGRVLAELAAAHAEHSEFCCEYRLMRPDGSERWIHDRSLVIRDGGGIPLYRQGYLLDITARRAAEERLAHLAYHDPLTGLPNRSMFREHLELSLARRARSGRSVAVLFVDLDDFKLVNDSLGHGAGDQLLYGVAARLRDAVRPSDVVARQGGDEFLILLSDLEAGDGESSPAAIAERVAADLLDALRTPFSVLDTEVFCSASVGISVCPADATTAESLLKHADIAMYRAKASGRHTCQVYRDDRTTLVPSVSLAARLARAIERRELHLHYQPLVEIPTGRMVGCEALARWNDGERAVPPAEFIPLAERTGLITPLTDWVVEEACRQAAEWQAAGIDLAVSINLPGALWEPRSLANVLRAVETAGLPPERLIIEITESAAMDRSQHSAALMQELQERGLRLAVDDFGTGHSSLSRLQEMSVSTLKIDRSFIANVPAEPSATLVATMVQLAASLGTQSLAEGIETEQQLRFLRHIGCQLGQGFLFSRPVPAAEIAGLYGRRAAA